MVERSLSPNVRLKVGREIQECLPLDGDEFFPSRLGEGGNRLEQGRQIDELPDTHNSLATTAHVHGGQVDNSWLALTLRTTYGN